MLKLIFILAVSLILLVVCPPLVSSNSWDLFVLGIALTVVCILAIAEFVKREIKGKSK